MSIGGRAIAFMPPKCMSSIMPIAYSHANHHTLLLLSAKNRNVRNNVSAVPIHRYCGFIFQKVSPPI